MKLFKLILSMHLISTTCANAYAMPLKPLLFLLHFCVHANARLFIKIDDLDELDEDNHELDKYRELTKKDLLDEDIKYMNRLFLGDDSSFSMRSMSMDYMPTKPDDEKPTPSPHLRPTRTPTPKPTCFAAPVPLPTWDSTTLPSLNPTLRPSPRPTLVPTPAPSYIPTLAPTPILTPWPLPAPNEDTTEEPSPEPSFPPTIVDF